MRGIVREFHNGYGFITGEDRRSYFVHFRKIRGVEFRQLTQGQQVEFEVKSGDRGLYADDVVVLDGVANCTTPERVQGTVRKYNLLKECGFIDMLNGTEVAVSRNELDEVPDNRLYPGQVVTFLLTQSSRGPRARSVRLLT